METGYFYKFYIFLHVCIEDILFPFSADYSLFVKFLCSKT